MSYFFNLLMFLEKTETSLPLKLPPQEQRAMQCKRCQATMFILSSLSQNALVLMIPCTLNIHTGKVSVKTLQSFLDIKFVIHCKVETKNYLQHTRTFLSDNQSGALFEHKNV